MPKTFPEFPNLFVMDHPLIQHKLSMMRDKNTPTILFRQLLKEIALLMGYELTRSLPITTRPIETPLTTFDAPILEGKKVAVVPILRAGLGMADGLLELVPSARLGHIGLYRDHETKRPVGVFREAAGPGGAHLHPGRSDAGDRAFLCGRRRHAQQARGQRRQHPHDGAGGGARRRARVPEGASEDPGLYRARWIRT